MMIISDMSNERTLECLEAWSMYIDGWGMMHKFEV